MTQNYEHYLNGQKTLATSGFSAILGDLVWNFESQKLKRWESTPSQDTLSQLNGAIEASAVRMTATYPLIINADVDTRADLRASVRYHQRNLETGRLGYNSYIADETIQIQTLQATKKSIDPNSVALNDSEIGTTILNGNFYSSGNVSVNSMGHLSFSGSDSSMDAYEVELIANRNLFNDTAIKADDIGLAGNNVVNRGVLQAFKSFEGFAQTNFINEFGGEVFGVDVNIQAQNGLVRNGSRTPYITNGSENTNLLSYGLSSFVILDPTQLGTFYKNGVDIKVLSAYKKAPKTHAYILGKNISISAKGVENINAYWEQVTNQSSHKLNMKYARQVVISSNGNLNINASSYFLNSSAVIASNSEQGVMSIKAPSVINERYRVLSVLDDKKEVIQEAVKVKNQNSIISRVEKYSPPGLLVSMGDLKVEALYGMLNSISYVDVYGSSLLYANKFGYYGISTGGFSKTLAKKFLFCLPYYNGYQVRQCPKGGYWHPAGYSHEAVDPKQLDALFSVQDDFRAVKFAYNASGDLVEKKTSDNKPDLLSIKIENFNTFEGYMDKVVSVLFERARGVIVNSNRSWGCGVIFHVGPGGPKKACSSLYNRVKKGPVGLVKEYKKNQIIFGVEYEARAKNIIVDYYFDPDPKHAKDKVTNKKKSFTFNLWNELKSYYEKAKSKFKALINEYKFWG